MGYYLEAFICFQTEANLLRDKFDKAVSVNIGQGLFLIPLTERLYDQINNFAEPILLNNFEYLSESIERNVLDTLGNAKFAYVEAEYFGGEGGQNAIIWNNGRREQILPFGQDKINQVLRYFGVAAKDGKDEFNTLGFHFHRNTKDWIEGTN